MFLFWIVSNYSSNPQDSIRYLGRCYSPCAENIPGSRHCLLEKKPTADLVLSDLTPCERLQGTVLLPDCGGPPYVNFSAESNPALNRWIFHILLLGCLCPHCYHAHLSPRGMLCLEPTTGIFFKASGEAELLFGAAIYKILYGVPDFVPGSPGGRLRPRATDSADGEMKPFTTSKRFY
ncbi:unnamed protein product [Tuber melanosporum]|uniref:(Perigord truffle) hypothetical protein n=1 Tax=Tuber melanosporum (strain Mel28) TaxID=656061 RepID=D5GJH1_TUBMM|nr:uncharacterized protein GSTUM_00009007001 [Tuber melanosporum]CAZ84664.1 unnamed protein product [Tuber melanosporum]